MRKLLLLSALLLTFFSAQAQVDTLFIETFDPGDSITTTSLGSATKIWKDTTNVSISGASSYHGRVQSPAVGSNSSEVVFRTNAFDTRNMNFVFLEFYHIAKINQVNQGLIRISTDNGATWTTISNTNVNYLGNSTWRSSSNFQEASYNIPNQGINHWFAGTDPPVANSWWQYEEFDISSLALGPNGTGYQNVMIEFSCFEALNPNITGRNYGAGWWVDNLLVLGSTCELFPPRFHFNYTPIPCYPVRPTGGIVEEPSSNYFVGARVTDTVPGGASNPTWVTGIDSVRVIYRVRNSTGVGAWNRISLAQINATFNEYRGTIPGIAVGDTVEYYYLAWDGACPNETRFPDSVANPANAYLRFWPETGLPFKCGAPDCGTVPGTISSFPWIENFEGPQWVAGTGVGDVGTGHRGNFPNEQAGMNYWLVQPPENQGGYGWSIRSGPTATPFTGPPSNHTPFGSKYVYAEASQGAQNTTTTLVTPCIDLRNENGCMAFEFYYHFFGEEMGTMRIDIDTGTNTAAWWNGYYFVRKQQQENANDPWERAIMPIYPFNGKFIRIRMLSAKQTATTGSLARADMAIDDLRLFEPATEDAEIMFTDVSTRQCSYGAAETVDVVIRNTGCDTLTSLPVQIQLNNGPILSETVTGLNLAIGDTITTTLSTTLNMSAIQTHTIRVWANLANDTNALNDTAVSEPIPNNPAWNTFPHITDFENVAPGSLITGDSLWFPTTGLDPNYIWVVGDRFTLTRGTGPSSGTYKKGQYMYTEASGSTGDVVTYLQTTRCVGYNTLSDPTLDFYYHAMGANFDRIAVEYNVPGPMDFNEWQEIPGSSVSVTNNHEMEDYKYHRVSLKNLPIAGSGRLRIAVHRKGVGDLSDVAIDKIMIYDRIASDAGVELVINPPLSAPAGVALPPTGAPAALIPSVEVRNFGTTNLSGVNVTVSVTPKCGPNAGQPTLYTSTAAASPLTNSSTTLVMPNLNMVIPAGECEVCAYTSVAGDSYSFNDTVCRTLSGLGTYDIDFFDDFDNCDYDEYGFFAQDRANNPFGYLQWERGEVPSGRQFSSAQAGDNVWATNISDGYYFDGTEERVRTPILDNFDTIVKPTIRFFQNIDMGNSAAGAVEAFFGGSRGWEPVGKTFGVFVNVGQNWYRSPFGTISTVTGTGVDLGFTGSSVSSQNPSGWVYSSYPMSEYNFEPNAIPFRFKFRSAAGANPGRNLEGWAIDDFEIWIPPQNSGTPFDYVWTNPLQIPTFDQPLDIIIQNTGAKLLDTVEVKAEVINQGGTNVWSGAWEATSPPRQLLEGDRFRFDYQDFWPGATVQPGPHTLRMITRRPNLKQDNRPSDDTTEFTVFVLPEYEFDTIAGDTVYCNDFEDGNGALPFITLNTKTYSRGISSWELGTPTQFPGAFSGTNCWMTGLDSNYRSRDESGLFTPVFVVDTSLTYEMSFVHKFETEKYHDGGVLEVTLDGGQTWSVLGFANELDWYNTEYVTALDIIKPGWTDTADWDTARYVFRFDTTADRAVFRFRFESDWSIQDKGWAVDDFCLKTTTKKSSFVIGSKDYNPVPDSYIGDLSPNPARGITHLPMFNAQAKSIEVNIINVVGQPVMQKVYNLERGSSELRFETLDWAAGVYFVNVIVDGERVTRKLVVQ